MKNFIQRNKQIVIIGLGFALLLGIIVFFSTTQNTDSPIVLTPFSTTKNVIEETINRSFNTDTAEDIVPTPEPIVIKPVQKSIIPEPKKERPDIEIIFMEGIGFSPKVKNAYVDQTVSWKNDSKEVIILDEMVTKEHNLSRIEVQPSESYEMILKEKGFWTYRELSSGQTGRLQVF